HGVFWLSGRPAPPLRRTVRRIVPIPSGAAELSRWLTPSSAHWNRHPGRRWWRHTQCAIARIGIEIRLTEMMREQLTSFDRGRCAILTRKRAALTGYREPRPAGIVAPV